MKYLLIAVFFLLGASVSARATTALGQDDHGKGPGHPPERASGHRAFNSKSALATSQDAVGRVIGDYAFTDTSGKTVRLADYRGAPLIISLIYTSCAHACPLITKSLRQAVEAAREVLPVESFRVASIGFDTPVDTPERMRQFADSHGVGGDANWSFLSADAGTIAALSRDLGFLFKKSPKGFDHLSQVTVVDGEGRVTRQIYGDNFTAPQLVEPLKDQIYGTRSSFASLEGIASKVRLFCTIYDPASGRYRFDYSLFIGMAIGAIIIIGTLIFLIRSWRRKGTGTPS